MLRTLISIHTYSLTQQAYFKDDQIADTQKDGAHHLLELLNDGWEIEWDKMTGEHTRLFSLTKWEEGDPIPEDDELAELRPAGYGTVYIPHVDPAKWEDGINPQQQWLDQGYVLLHKDHVTSKGTTLTKQYQTLKLDASVQITVAGDLVRCKVCGKPATILGNVSDQDVSFSTAEEASQIAYCDDHSPTLAPKTSLVNCPNCIGTGKVTLREGDPEETNVPCSRCKETGRLPVTEIMVPGSYKDRWCATCGEELTEWGQHFTCNKCGQSHDPL